MYLNRKIPEHLIESLLNAFYESGGLLISTDFIYPLIDNNYKIKPQLSNIYKSYLQLLEEWNIATDGDIIGYLYQKIETTLDKKNKGQFFTPLPIIDTILDDVLSCCNDFEVLKNCKILDPSCGSGQFLINMYNRLFLIYTDNGYDKFRAAEAIISNNLFGFDIDPVAVSIAKYNLSKLSGINITSINNIDCKNSILKDYLQFDQQHTLDNQFDVIVGNPPWGSSLSAEEKKYYRKTYSSAKSGINTFTLFIERSLELLKESGTLSFLVPEALLNIKAHQNCRKYILENCLIKNITLWGDQFEDVYNPAVSFLLKKSSQLQKQNSFFIRSRKESRAVNDLIISQNSLIHNYQNIININYSQQTQDIISHIDNSDSYYLENHAQFFLGIVTGNNGKHIHKYISDDHPDRILLGQDLSPYKINYSGHTFRYDPLNLQQTAPQQLYLSETKILYKFIGKRLTFAIDRQGYYTLNSVNGFIPDMETVSPEAMLAIFNSTLMQYFYEKKFFTVKALRGNLEKLPIKKLSRSAEKLLSDLSCQMMQSETNAEAKTIQENIDDIVFKEYNINDKQAYNIWETYNSDKAQMFLPGT